MDLPTPPAVLATLASFVRARLAEVHETLWGLVGSRRAPDSTAAAEKQVAGVLVSSAAPFAANSYARTRLLRQMHAAGLLTTTETARAERVLGVAEKRPDGRSATPC